MVDSHENRMQRALDCINDELGKQFILSERLQGKSGAWAVDSLDGERGILKISDGSDCGTVERTVHLAEHLRSKGYPTPRPLHHGSIPNGGSYYLQERLTGHPMRSPGVWSELNRHELGILLHQLDLHAGIAPGMSQDWTCQIEEIALAQQNEWLVVVQSPLSVIQSLLSICARRCNGLGDPGWRHTDLVIGDFGPHNVLLNDQSQVAALFDLEGAGRGDRVIDMVGLFYMAELELIPDVRREVLKIATPAALTACGVYWIVHRLYQGIRANAENLEPIAQQMLAHVDILT
jgi:Ser/Thr protein kinase RdoA (MazF antagonist)